MSIVIACDVHNTSQMKKRRRASCPARRRFEGKGYEMMKVSQSLALFALGCGRLG
jgi:hypothetical protein